jgi:hypothetical protein
VRTSEKPRGRKNGGRTNYGNSAESKRQQGSRGKKKHAKMRRSDSGRGNVRKKESVGLANHWNSDGIRGGGSGEKEGPRAKN